MPAKRQTWTSIPLGQFANFSLVVPLLGAIVRFYAAFNNDYCLIWIFSAFYIKWLNTRLLAFHGAINNRFQRNKNGPAILVSDTILENYPLPVLWHSLSSWNPEDIIGKRKRLRLQLQAVTAMPLSLPRYDNEEGETSPIWACLLTYLSPFALSADYLLAKM